MFEDRLSEIERLQRKEWEGPSKCGYVLDTSTESHYSNIITKTKKFARRAGRTYTKIRRFVGEVKTRYKAYSVELTQLFTFMLVKRSTMKLIERRLYKKVVAAKSHNVEVILRTDDLNLISYSDLIDQPLATIERNLEVLVDLHMKVELVLKFIDSAIYTKHALAKLVEDLDIEYYEVSNRSFIVTYEDNKLNIVESTETLKTAAYLKTITLDPKEAYSVIKSYRDRIPKIDKVLDTLKKKQPNFVKISKELVTSQQRSVFRDLCEIYLLVLITMPTAVFDTTHAILERLDITYNKTIKESSGLFGTDTLAKLIDDTPGASGNFRKLN